MKPDYADGYVYGQHDALTWLSTPPHEDDRPLAAFDFRVQFRAALVCLAHNLAVGAALCRAFWDGVRHEAAHHMDAPWIDRDWHPGCGRSLLP